MNQEIVAIQGQVFRHLLHLGWLRVIKHYQLVVRCLQGLGLVGQLLRQIQRLVQTQ